MKALYRSIVKLPLDRLIKPVRFIKADKWRQYFGFILGLMGMATSLIAQSGLIENDTLWTDDNGTMVMASMGGHITQVGDTYYWVGNDPQRSLNGHDIHLYSSKTLGSGDWKHEGKMVDLQPGEGHNNCTLLRSPATGNFVIVAKSGLRFYESKTVTGPYNLVRTIYKNELGNHYNFKVGGMGTYQEGEEAYVITSRRYLGTENNNRYTAIYRLTPDFTNVAEEILWLRNDSREAMWLFKRGDTYYMSASHTAGWTPSDCYYRTATYLAGPWSEEKMIGMDPLPTGRLTRSHGTQHRYIIQVNDQWIYGGDRYPYQEAESYSSEKGLKIICPVIWEGDHPVVKWQQTWTIDATVSPFDAWANLHFILSGPNGNEDGDSANNLMEYAIGGNPLDPTDQGTLPTLENFEDKLRYRFPRLKAPANGVSYSVQYSDSLAPDSWNDFGPIEIGTEALNANFDWVVNDIPMPQQSLLFIRLEVVQE